MPGLTGSSPLGAIELPARHGLPYEVVGRSHRCIAASVQNDQRYREDRRSKGGRPTRHCPLCREELTQPVSVVGLAHMHQACWERDLVRSGLVSTMNDETRAARPGLRGDRREAPRRAYAGS